MTLRFVLLLALSMLLIAVVGCTTISHREPPQDRPLLSVREHAVPPAVVWQQCYQFVPTWQKLLGAVPEGCAILRFDLMTCDIYLPTINGAISQSVLEHEREHCRLKDHFGTTQLADAWAAWKAYMTRDGARYVYVGASGKLVVVK